MTSSCKYIFANCSFRGDAFQSQVGGGATFAILTDLRPIEERCIETNKHTMAKV